MAMLSLFVIWHIFFSEYVTDLKNNYVEHRALEEKISKISKVKLVSDNRKEIEDFVTENAEHLSNETVKLLVARIESIKDDRVIADDDLKVRFKELDKEEVSSGEALHISNKGTV